jgi:hypothetical protein
MAILTQCLGSITGRVGGLVFRERNGKTIVSKAPKQKQKTFDPLRKLGENKFGTTGKIASAVNSSPYLNDIWRKTFKSSRNIHNKIFKEIYRQMNGEDFSKSGSIMPEPGMVIKGYLTPGVPDILVETEAPGVENGIYPEEEKSIMAIGVVILSDPVNTGVPDTMVVKIASEPRGLRVFFPQTFVAKVPASEILRMRSYKKQEYFVHLITLDSNGKAVHYSERIGR